MGKRYRHVTIEERCEVARLHALGYPVRKIAAALDRSPSTVVRELKRNRSRTQGYQPRYADQHAHARRWRGSRLERDAELRLQVLSRLKHGWSPEQVAGRMARESGKRVISHESIYRFIYAQIARKKDYSWRHYLPRAKSKRGWRGRRGGSSASFIAHRVPLAQRPQEAANRQIPGHWEADLMAFGRRGPVVLALHERHSRLLLALRPRGKASSPIASAMRQVLGPLPPAWRQSVTFDNGTEFAPSSRIARVGHTNLLLRYPLTLAEGGRGERHRPDASHPSPKDRPGNPLRRPVCSTRTLLQQYAAQMSGVPHPSRNLFHPRVALAM